ncbi:MAG: hypothetical protein EBX45_06510, partial [Burkholderiaceae bacterium]|nr:hypothetical protein [Burkholderiaceae bacterium]
LSELTGRRAVELAKTADQKTFSPRAILTPKALTNALTVLHAIGGSTNALIHITAVAARLGIKIDLDMVDQLGRNVPVLVDLKPSGAHYMEHLYEDGGLMAVLRELKPHLYLDCLTVSGKTLGEEIEDAKVSKARKVIRISSDPIYPVGGLAILRGNLAPRGAVIKHSAASPDLLKHRGRAVVFSSLEDLALRIDSAERLAIPESGYRRLYQTTVTQADIGCDFDFMVPSMTGTAPVLKGR